MRLIHSKHYFDLCQNIELDKNIIQISKSKKPIMKLINLPLDENVNIKVEKYLVKKKSLINCLKLFGIQKTDHNTKYNTVIAIEINNDIIIKHLKQGIDIPYRNELFTLIKNNNKLVELDENIMLHELKVRSKHNLDIPNIVYYNNNIVSYNNLFFDIKLDRIYLKEQDIKKQTLKLNGNILFYQSEKNIEKYLSFILKKSTIIVYNDVNLFLPLVIKSNLDYIIIDKNKLDIYTYSDIFNKIVLVHYDILNIMNNKLTDDIIETKKYELSLLDSEVFFNKSKICLYSLDYDLIIFDDKYMKYTKIIDNVNLLNGKNKIVTSKYFLHHNINTFKNMLYTYFEIDSNFNNNQIINILNNSIIEKIQKVNVNTIYLKLNKYEDDVFNSVNYIDYELFLSTSLNITKLNFKMLDKNDEKFRKNNTCSICLENINENNFCKLECNHYYCFSCVNSLIVKKCPLCRKNIDLITIVKKDINKINNNNKKPNMGIKMQTLIENIRNKQLIISKFTQTTITISNIFNTFNIEHTLLNKKSKINKYNYQTNENNIYLCDYDTFNTLDLIYFDLVDNVIFMEDVSSNNYYIVDKLYKNNIKDIKSLSIVL